MSTALHLLWEIGQLPLYTLYHEGTRSEIAYALAHCTAGDVLIAAGAYALVAVLVRTFAWPSWQPILGGIALVALAVGYTVFSEWLNVYVRQSWTYSAAMPQLFGIGVSPLLQWVVVPAAATAASRMIAKT